MSIFLKAIIPLAIPGATLDDIDIMKGFRGIFTYDINRPWLDNHIFVLYDYNVTPFFISRDERFKKHPTFFGRKIVVIKGYTLACYVFTKPTASINHILSNHWISISKDEKLKIFKFWNFTDDEINKWMVTGDDMLFEDINILKGFENKVVPEWDANPKEDWWNEIGVQLPDCR